MPHMTNAGQFPETPLREEQEKAKNRRINSRGNKSPYFLLK
ncbi:hypothetical protein HMPREF1981_01510 [Bacteroides pyogenes F0041]|uniref:Uncharacterized protein n=1 Tax=Bacteroides pyogenes F0041 TaxID=1321819 RepID=U2CM82_9BACE|nr:hypothetical protein HMPREF1981_01510 [Bacteroides pyogenes F0041]